MEKINSFKSTDGKLFDSALSCASYELGLIFQKYREPGKRQDGIHGKPITAEQVFNTVLDKPETHAILNSFLDTLPFNNKDH